MGIASMTTTKPKETSLSEWFGYDSPSRDLNPSQPPKWISMLSTLAQPRKAHHKSPQSYQSYQSYQITSERSSERSQKSQKSQRPQNLNIPPPPYSFQHHRPPPTPDLSPYTLTPTSSELSELFLHPQDWPTTFGFLLIKYGHKVITD